jgi:hypothetical protein
MGNRKRTRSRPWTGNSALKHIVEFLTETAEPSRLFEFSYWCQEPDLLKIVRACAALPEEHRRVIAAFFAAVDGNELDSADWLDDRLILSCQNAPQKVHPGSIAHHSETKTQAHQH